MTTPAGTMCTRPGCGGRIDEGYCDICGLAPDPAPATSGSPPAAQPSGSQPSGSRPGGRRGRRGSSRSSRGHLGAGLVEVPPVASRDPATAVLADPLVPEGKRFCGACDRPVGRGREGQPGLTEGFCANCGTPFSFAPKLQPGELVAGQYEVLGCLAHDALPGELAAKLALALATEAAGDLATANRYFQLVLTVDPSYVSAAFGLARARLAGGDPAGAVRALAAVPETSSRYLDAQVTAVRIQVSSRPDSSGVSPDDLRQAGGRLAYLKLDAIAQESLTAEVLRAALEIVAGGPPLGGQLLGCELSERALRFGLERSYRAQARLSPDQHRRVELVEMANAVRPRTWS